MAKITHIILIALVLFAFVAHEAESIDLFSKIFKLFKFKKMALLKAKPLAALALAKPLKKLALAKPLLMKKALIAKPLLLKKALIAKPLLLKKALIAKPLLAKPLALGAVGVGAVGGSVAVSHLVQSSPVMSYTSHYQQPASVSVTTSEVSPVNQQEQVVPMTKH